MGLRQCLGLWDQNGRMSWGSWDLLCLSNSDSPWRTNLAGPSRVQRLLSCPSETTLLENTVRSRLYPPILSQQVLLKACCVPGGVWSAGDRISSKKGPCSQGAGMRVTPDLVHWENMGETSSSVWGSCGSPQSPRWGDRSYLCQVSLKKKKCWWTKKKIQWCWIFYLCPLPPVMWGNSQAGQ